MSIVIENITKQYADFTLKNVSFQVPDGSIVGFVGENGAGKTTTLKAILDIISLDGGKIKVFGKDPKNQGEKIKQDIGVVMDEGFFYDVFSPREIEAVLKRAYKNWNSSVFYQYLRQFNLPEKKMVKEFSKGMKMKLLLATALSHDPKLLLLDEATSGLDPIVRNEILDIFLDFMQDETHSILFSSHITSDLEKIADYIVFLHQGEVILCEEKDKLLEEYGILKCGITEWDKVEKADCMAFQKNIYSIEALVKNRDSAKRKYKNMVVDSVGLDEIMLLLVKGEKI